MSEAVLEKLKDSFLELDREATLESVGALLEEGAAGAEAGVEAITDALGVVGKRFQDGDWFLGELVYAGEIAKDAMDLLAPHFAAEAAGRPRHQHDLLTF